MSSFREYLDATSRFGRYQLLQIVLGFIVILGTATQNLAIIFTGLTPDFRCDGVTKDKLDSSAADFDSNLTNVCLANNTCPQLVFLGEMETVVTKYNLVCERKYLLPLIPTLYMVGFFWGSPAYGYLSDRFGRKKSLLASGMQAIVCSIVSAFVPNYITYVIFSALKAFGVSGMLAVALTYMVECSSNKNRAAVVTLTTMPWAVAYFVLGGVYYVLQSHTYLELVITVFQLSTVAVYFLCQESPRWLMVKGRKEEARIAIQRISQMNKWNLSVTDEEIDEWMQSIADQKAEENEEVSFKSFFSNSTLMRISVCVWFGYFTVSLQYYGLAYGSSSLKAWSIYKQVFVVAAIEVVTKICFIPVIKYSERLVITILSVIIISSLTLVVAGLVSTPSMAFTITILCVAARPVVGFQFIVEDLYTTEVYPTTHRNLGVGCVSAAVRLGGICGSQMITLGQLWEPAPYVIYGACGVIVVLLKCFLPETKYRPCPDTVSETKEVLKCYSFYRKLPCCKQKHRANDDRRRSANEINMGDVTSDFVGNLFDDDD